MALDNAQYIAALSPSDPAATDPIGEGDDHIRTLKTVLANTFIGDIGASDTYDSINGPILIGPTVTNALPGRVTVLENLPHNNLSSPPAIGDVAPNTGAFITLDLVSGATVNKILEDFTGSDAEALVTHEAIKTYIAAQPFGFDPSSPSPIGDVAPNTGQFTTLTDTELSGVAERAVSVDAAGKLQVSTLVSGLVLQSEQTASFTAEVGKAYPCDTSAGGFTMTLPVSPSIDDKVGVIDVEGTMTANNLLLGRNGESVFRAAEDGAINQDNWSSALIFVGGTTGWLRSGF